MEVILADWEKENLNRKVTEIVVSESDTCKELEDAFKKIDNDCDYIVIKLPSNNHEYLFMLQENGFTFVENQISLNLSIENSRISKFERLGERYNLKKVENEDDINCILNSISCDMFKTDRIALDPKFGLEVANSRYKKWLQNEYAKSNFDIFRVMKSNKDIGFVMINDKYEEMMGIILGGVYSKYQNMGMGFNVVYQPIKYCQNSDKKQIKTKVSSNNINVIRLYIEMGYEIEAMDYIYVKHREERNDSK